MTNIRCHVWCYWEQEFWEPMGTYLAHHWLVSETVVTDKNNTNVGWVFDFFVIPICSDYLKEKKQNERTIGSGYLNWAKKPEWEMRRTEARGGGGDQLLFEKKSFFKKPKTSTKHC